MNKETERHAKDIERVARWDIDDPAAKDALLKHASHMRALQAELDSSEKLVEKLNSSWTSKGCRYEQRIAKLEKAISDETELLRQLAKAERERDDARAELAKIEHYKAFAVAVMSQATENTGACDDLGGDVLQDLAAEHGLLVPTRAIVPCGDHCNCLDFVDAGEHVTCYRHGWDK